MNYFDKQFVREFKSVIQELKVSTSTQFNLNLLGIPKNDLSTVVYRYAEIRGVDETSVFSALNGKPACISNITELSENGFYSFSNRAKSLRVSKDKVLVGSQELIKIPNKYVSPDNRISYLGLDKYEDGSYMLFYAVSKELVYPKPTYVVTISTKKVANHYGGREILLTNGREVQIVVQDRTRIRSTDAKSVYYMTSSLSQALDTIDQMHKFLVQEGKTFHPIYFKIEDDGADGGVSYNLVYKDLDATEDIGETIVDYSLKELESGV